MPRNQNPLTPLRMRFLECVRDKLIEIDDPLTPITGRSYDFTLKSSKEFGTIPWIVFRPNSGLIKSEIMKDLGYLPLTEKNGVRANIRACEKAFDSHWNHLMFGFTKSAVHLLLIDKHFQRHGESVSRLLNMIQQSLDPKRPSGTIHNPNTSTQSRSYIEELAEVNDE